MSSMEKRTTDGSQISLDGFPPSRDEIREQKRAELQRLIDVLSDAKGVLNEKSNDNIAEVTQKMQGGN